MSTSNDGWENVNDGWETISTVSAAPKVTVQYSGNTPTVTGPDDLKLLYENAKTVGYSGLDDAQKKLFQENFPQSKAAKNGMTLEDAIRATDLGKSDKSVYETVVTPITDAYRWTKENVTAPMAAVPISLADAIPGFGQYREGTTYLKRVAQSQQEQMDQVRKGEFNLAGFIGAPENFLPFAASKIPGLVSKLPFYEKVAEGLNAAKKATVIPEKVEEYVAPVAKFADEHPYISGLVRGAGSGAGYGSVAQLDRPEGDAIPTPTDLAKGAGYGSIPGAVLGLGGSWLREHAIENYPGMEKLSMQEMKGVKNTGVNEMTRPQRIQVYDDLLKENILPTIEDYYELGKKYTSMSSKDFKVADELFDNLLKEHGYPLGGVTTDRLEKAITDAITNESRRGGRLANSVKESDIQTYVQNKMSRVKHTASLEQVKISDALLEKLKKDHPDINTDELAKKIVPISDMKSILQNLNKDIGGIMSKTPTTDADMAMAAREGIVEQILKGKGIQDDPLVRLFAGQIPTVDRNGKVIDVAFKPYEEHLAPKTRENYALGMKIQKNVANQGQTGPRGRAGIPFLGEAAPHIYTNLKSNYAFPALTYGLGDRLSNKLLTPGGIVSSSVSKHEVDKKKKSK